MILTLLLSSVVAGAAEPAYCQRPARATVERRYPLPDNVNYFIRASQTPRRIGLATASGNKMVNLDTGEIEDVPGSIDPVPSPDGQLLVVPLAKIYNPATGQLITVEKKDEDKFKSVRFFVFGKNVQERILSTPLTGPDTATGEEQTITSQFTIKDLHDQGVQYLTSTMDLMQRKEASGAAGKPGYETAYSDHDITENYQSVGVLRSTPTSGQYRLLYEGDGALKFRDYSLDFATGRATPAGPIQDMCGAKTEGTLPVISKNGTEFTTYNSTTQKTQVFAFNAATSSCKLVDTIPALVGKVDFSPDNRLLAFHVDQGASPSGGIFEEPGEENKFGVYLYDRARRSIIAVDDDPAEDSYYPVFVTNDTIAYVSTKKGADKKREYFINLARLNIQPGLTCTDCAEETRNGQLAALLGRLYNSKCSQPNATFTNAMVGFSRLNAARCRQLLQNTTPSHLAGVMGADLTGGGWKPELLGYVTIADLQKLCKEQVQATTPAPTPVTK